MRSIEKRTREAEERIKNIEKTSKITGLSIKKINVFLRDYTHSEIRIGKYNIDGKFKPGKFQKTRDLKLGNGGELLI